VAGSWQDMAGNGQGTGSCQWFASSLPVSCQFLASG